MCTRMWARGNKKEFFSFVMAKALKFISLIKFYFMEVRGGLGNIFLWENSNFKFFYWSWHNFWYATSIKKRGFNVITKLFFLRLLKNFSPSHSIMMDDDDVKYLLISLPFKIADVLFTEIFSFSLLSHWLCQLS